MRDRMERFVILPFTLGCVSEPCVAVSLQQHYPKRPSKAYSKSCTNSVSSCEGEQEEEEEERSSSASMKDALRFLTLPKSNFSPGLPRLLKGFRNIAQLLVYKEEIEEMEIGSPTDVKHVTHIGLDGSATTPSINSTKAWENLINSEFIPSSVHTLDLHAN